MSSPRRRAPQRAGGTALAPVPSFMNDQRQERSCALSSAIGARRRIEAFFGRRLVVRGASARQKATEVQ